MCIRDSIRKAFRKISLQLHPDKLQQRGLDPKDYEAEYQLVQEAYGVLSDKKKRSEYNNLGDSPSRYQFVASGNAELGFIASSQWVVNGQPLAGSSWLVPQSLHSPLRQDAVLLTSGQANPAAIALMGFLQSPRARAVMREHGYTH